MNFLFVFRGAALSLLVCGPGYAQDYPNKAVRVIVPWAAGGVNFP